MDYIFQILSTVLLVVAGFLFTYLKRSEKAKLLSEKAVADAVAFAKIIAQKASELITKAELEYEGTGRGKEKFNFVVDAIMKLIPDELELFFPRALIEAIVQSVFEGMAEFASAQIDKVLDKIMPDVEPASLIDTDGFEPEAETPQVENNQN